MNSAISLQLQEIQNSFEQGLDRKLTCKTLTAIELCAGGGGAALGLEMAGFTHVALVEINRDACSTLRNNRPFWNVLETDLKDFDGSSYYGIDILTGGLPCPPFSIAGKQLGVADERNMFPHMLRIVKETNPRAILIENVKGLLGSRFISFRADINENLNRLGYETYWTSLNAAHYGAPQNRSRTFLVALKSGQTKPLFWPVPTMGQACTVGKAIGDLMASNGWRGAQTWAEQASIIAPTIVGGSHKHGGPDLGPTRARSEWASIGIDGLGLANNPPDETFQGKPRLTLRMVARLQGFPDDWKFSGSKTQAYRQVGNALPVTLAYKVALAVRECLE